MKGVTSHPTVLLFWGIDELLSYHYLVAPLFGAVDKSNKYPESYFHLLKSEQANLVWNKRFTKRSRINKACCRVLTTISASGLDPR